MYRPGLGGRLALLGASMLGASLVGASLVGASLVGASLVGAGPAVAQPAASAPAAGRAFGLEVHGVFRDLMLEGDFSPKVAVPTVMAKRPTTGVGALAGARGEITILDGKLIVTYGRPDVEPPAGGETAALLAAGKAAGWQVITVDHDIGPDHMEAYLVNRARAYGLDPERSFPFQFSGVISPYALHVNAAPTNGPHGMDRPMAISAQRKGETIGGHVAGLYVSSDLVGIATHGGERIHSHWVASDRSETAHLDRWGIKAGSVLMLPKPE